MICDAEALSSPCSAPWEQPVHVPIEVSQALTCCGAMDEQGLVKPGPLAAKHFALKAEKGTIAPFLWPQTLARLLI